MKTPVVIVDDHASVREMVALVLAGEEIYSVVGHARTGFEAVQLCRKRKVGLIILDLELPEMNGAEVLKTLRPEMPETRCLVYSGTDQSNLVHDAFRTNPHGFVHKRDELAEFREALRAVAKGRCYFTPYATQLRDRAPSGTTPRPMLTDRERQILQMIAEGMTNKGIADRLKVACRTVEHHRSNLMEKLNIHDTARLTRFAVKLGLVSVDSV